eukprot:UN25097
MFFTSAIKIIFILENLSLVIFLTTICCLITPHHFKGFTSATPRRGLTFFGICRGENVEISSFKSRVITFFGLLRNSLMVEKN